MTRKKGSIRQTHEVEEADIGWSFRYIDESANQEAPSLHSPFGWVNSGSTFIPTNECVPKILPDVSSTTSSGYFSSSSRSAPPGFVADTAFDSYSQPEFSSPSGVLEGGNSKENPLFPLRRSQSCKAEWLVKRTRVRQSWPRLSGISRRSEDLKCCANFARSLFTSNASYRRVLGAISNKPGLSGFRDKRVKSCVRFADLSSPTTPVYKKQRFEMREALVPCDISPVRSNLDDTIAPDDAGLDDLSSPEFPLTRGGLPFDISCRQSTPRIQGKEASVLESSYVQAQPCKLPRFSSVPANVENDRLLSLSDSGGDGRGPRALPVIERTASGVNFVSADTVARLIKGEYEERKVNFLIVDCRYPYEFEGGHVKNALNVYTPNDLVREVFYRIPAQDPSGGETPIFLGDQLDQLLTAENPELSFPTVSEFSPSSSEDSIEEQDSEMEDDVLQHARSLSMNSPESSSLDESAPTERQSPMSIECSVRTDDQSPVEPSFVVIFHCEFSSQRAPSMATFLRNIDRTMNCNRYPFLFFPELYVMKGGYSEFHKRFPEHCEPSNYVTMFDIEFRGELRFYRYLTKRVFTACQRCFRDAQFLPRYSTAQLTFEHFTSNNKDSSASRLMKAASMGDKASTSRLTESIRDLVHHFPEWGCPCARGFVCLQGRRYSELVTANSNFSAILSCFLLKHDE
ncbi:unnamed protein product [Mesocestoides corti]|uniref:protein-tyrosine-phosphatase n=1 Tax=Mesocestoides corti TaxID=53468 RepID=A0A0R3U3W8_MESCO|nr:unnamed protein product [Mesocestoides corti]